MKLYPDHDRIDARRSYFSSRVCAPWNSLPAEVIHSESVMAFKRKLRGCSLLKFLKQNVDCLDHCEV